VEGHFAAVIGAYCVVVKRWDHILRAFQIVPHEERKYADSQQNSQEKDEVRHAAVGAGLAKLVLGKPRKFGKALATELCIVAQVMSYAAT
jgi:hypothetical protein